VSHTPAAGRHNVPAGLPAQLEAGAQAKMSVAPVQLPQPPAPPEPPATGKLHPVPPLVLVGTH
jgi:hypothetical protein